MVIYSAAQQLDEGALSTLRVSLYTAISNDAVLFDTLEDYLSPYAPIPDVEVRGKSTMVDMLCNVVYD